LKKHGLTTVLLSDIDNVIVNGLKSGVSTPASFFDNMVMSVTQQKPLSVGMVGGGPDSGIGETHRIAMRIDNKCELVAGVFSRRLEKSSVLAKQLGIPPERLYGDYKSMASEEAKRTDKIDAVCIVTPTDSHYEIARQFLQVGIHVICDKPLCVSLSEARELTELADRAGLVVCLTHNYTGYAMVRHAARMVTTFFPCDLQTVTNGIFAHGLMRAERNHDVECGRSGANFCK